MTTLILLHGYPFDHSLWDSVVERLPKKMNVIVPDLPGFGSTPVDKSEPSLDRMADYVASLLQGERIEEAVVAGMSMGGYVALAFAEKYPSKLAGLGLISTHAWADTEEARKGRRDMIEKVRKEGPQAAVAAALPKLLAPANQSNESFKKFPTEGAQRAGVDGICWALEAMARRPDRTVVLRQMSVPVLIFHGVDDKFIPAERARQMTELAADCQYIEVPKAGHATPLESPESLADALIKLHQRAEQRETQKKPHDRGVIIAPMDR